MPGGLAPLVVAASVVLVLVVSQISSLDAASSLLQFAGYYRRPVGVRPVPVMSARDLALLQRSYMAYKTAIENARATEAEIRRLMTSYKKFHRTRIDQDDSPLQVYQQRITPVRIRYVRQLVRPAAAVDRIAAQAWEESHALLKKLHAEIEEEQDKLANMNKQTQNLAEQHEEIRQSLSNLLFSSRSTAQQMENLRDIYAKQVSKVQGELRDAEQERQKAVEAARKRSDVAWGVKARLTDQLARAIASSNHYDLEVEQAKAYKSLMRSQAGRAAGEAQKAKKQLEAARESAAKAREEEDEAVAHRRVDEVKAKAIQRATWRRDVAGESLARAKAKLMETSMSAKVQVAMADEAKEDAKKAAEEAERAKQAYQDRRAALVHKEEEIIDAKLYAQEAAAEEELYGRKLAEAQADLERVMMAREEAVNASRGGQEAVGMAAQETSLAMAQAEWKAKALEAEISALEKEVEESRAEMQKSAAKAHGAEEESAEMQKRKEDLLEQKIFSNASAAAAVNELSLEEEKSLALLQRAERVEEEAAGKKGSAEALLKTVDGLAGLARHAAAAAQPPMAFVAPPVAQASGKQTIDIHVIPHAPVLGPMGEEGMFAFDSTDNGSKKLRKAGLNV
ncbi:hypothetical protein GUITHDRAFT_115982 [Guillardia theta CCMP2712]|uniref:Uncharacterized protein n=2 Tax=Guillardia theta TaxID=55529 RepID=L1IP62_GUITC|nr:hypothetical protein GUITHDRAFT_115982 [Guillardia theta CCMP2712]EKX37842.1 hypothetical protein GUITHDRAFT_115982 [Guillardia theta CCMP2712]|eukprot:XP_005824822.1 hypothetical protein GUITHDRAFT_115982 [Guillardia theta CCMP2712]